MAKALASGHIDEESNAVFDLRLALSRRRLRPVGHVWWERLAKNHPKRCMQLFDLHLRVFVRAGSALKDGQSENLVSTGMESQRRDEAQWLRKPAARYPCFVWSRIAPICVPMERLHRWSQRRHSWRDPRSPISQVFDQTAADAALAASIFHYGEYSIEQTKRYLADHAIPVRLVA